MYDEFLDTKQITINIEHVVLLSHGNLCVELHCSNGFGFIFFPGRLLKMLKSWHQPLLAVFQGCFWKVLGD